MYEVELRSFITKEKYDELLAFFHKQAQFLTEDEQTTYYFDAPVDLRLQQNKAHCKLIIKKGAIHDEVKEEFEVPFAHDDFKRVHELLLALGYKVSVQWLRKRLAFRWEDVLVTLDDTKGYGLILELEKPIGVCKHLSISLGTLSLSLSTFKTHLLTSFLYHKQLPTLQILLLQLISFV